MKTAWLKLILDLTNRIYRSKQTLIEQEGFGMIKSVLLLFFLELALSLISLPLYLGLRTEKVIAFFREKGSYDSVVSDYRLRRILTLTGVAIIFFVWFLKILIILLTPKIVGPLSLYKVINFAPTELTEESLNTVELEIETAPYLDTIKMPQLSGVEKLSGGRYAFFGKGHPLSTIVLFLRDQQTAIYTEEVDASGNWRIIYTKKDFRLSEGNHAVAAYCYKEDLGGRSRLSTQQYFKVTQSWLDRLVENSDNIINILLILIILSGVFIMILIV